MKRQLFLVVSMIILGFSGALYGQQNYLNHGIKPVDHSKHQDCGFDARHEYLMKNDPAYVQRRAEVEQHYQEFLKNPVTNKATYTIPVVVHVIHTGQAVGVGANISDAQIQSAIDNLNAAYSNTSTALTTYTGVDTEIQFCLAQRDPSGNPTTGILRVDGSGVTGYATKGVCDAGGGTGTDNENAVKALSKWDNTKYYNVWIVTEINDNNAGSGTQGYAYFPGASSAKDGTIILYNSFGYDPDGSIGYNLKSYTNRNITFIHELGHGLNLYHTFEGDNNGASCPSGNGCGSGVGDCVSDTPPHRRSSSDCNTGGTNSCDGGSSNSLFVHNFMDYSSDDCQTEFTAGQKTRLVATMTGARASLTTSDGCNPVFANDAGILAVVNPSSAVCGTDLDPIITLKNFGSSTLTSVTISYDIDGGTTQTFNWTGSLASNASENVTLPTYSSTAGAHTFNVATSNPNGGSDDYAANDSKSIAYSAAGTAPASTCAPSTTNTGNFGTGIIRVQFNTIDNAHTANDNDGTQDFVCSDYTTVDANTAYTLTITLDNGNSESCQAYIDYNDNGTYEASEQVYTSGPVGSGVHTTSVTIPQFPDVTGKLIRMRVISDFGGISGPCNTLTYGEIEDYGIYITPPPCSAPVVNTDPTDQGGCAGLNATFTAAFTGSSPITYQWQVDNGSGYTNVSDGGIYSNATTNALTLTGFTVGENGYKYRCVATNACGTATSNEASLVVAAAPTSTCSPATVNTGNFGTGIIRVQFNVIDNNHNLNNNDGTQDFTCTKNTTVDANTTHTLTVTLSNGNPENCRVYIDYNDNGTYEASEIVLDAASTGSGVHTTSVTIPAAPAVTGKMIRMRVISDFAGITGGCADVQYGEVEDYGIYITPPPCTNPTVDTDPSNATVCAGDNTSFSVSSSDATGYQWQVDTGSGFGDAVDGGTISGATTNTITITGATAGMNGYIFRCNVSNACSTVASGTATLTVNSVATPTISAGGATTFCTGGSVTLTSSSATGNTWSTGATTQSITASTAGNYTVTVTQSGCSATSAATTVTVNTPPTITEGTLTSPTTCGGSDGSIEVSGTGTGTISWTGTSSGSMPGATLPASITGLGAGSYSITFDNGCTSNTLSSTLSDPSAPATPTITSSDADNALCPGETLTLTSSAASGNTWSTGATTQSITVSAAGTFTVTHTVAGCSSTSAGETVTMNTAPATPTITAGGATTFCNGSSVTLTSSSATSNTWSTGETTQAITVSATGNYTVTVTQSGCSSTSTATSVTVQNGPTITLGTTSNPTACAASDGSIQISGTGTGNLSWTGTASGNMTGVTLPVTVTGLAAGSYSFVFDDGCPSNALSGSLSDPGAPSTPTITSSDADNTVCQGETITLTSSAATGNTWSNGETTQSITVSASGTFNVTIVVSGCSATSSDEVVTVNASPTIAVGTTSDPSACGVADGTIQIIGTGTGTVSWTGTSSGSMSATTLPALITALTAGNYDITFDNGCPSNTISQTLTDPSAPATPTITASGATTFCSGGSVTLTSSAASGNTWSTGETTQSITVSATGNYSVTVTQSGCSATSAATSVTVQNGIAITLGTTTDPTACGASDGSIQISGTGTGDLSWTGTASGSMTGVSLPATVTGLAAGSYDFTFDDGCPSNTVSGSISDPGAPTTPTITSSDADNTICQGETITLTSSAATGNTWSTGETTQSISVSATGTYTVTVNVSGCTATSAGSSVTVNANPSITQGTATDPSGCGTSDGSIEILGTGTGTLSWSGAASGSSSVTLPHTEGSLAAGAYNFTFDDGCTSNTVTVSLTDPGAPAAPTITASGPTTFCDGGSVTLTSSSATDNVWSTGETTQSITVTASGTYSVSLNVGGCVSTAASQVVDVTPIPATTVTIASDDADNDICDGTSVTFTASVVDGGTTPSYQWKVDGSNVGTDSPNYTDNALADGAVITCDVTNTDACGTTVTSNSISMTVNANAPASLTITSDDADNSICSGTNVTFTATAVNGGATPTLTWKRNGSSALIGASFSTSILQDGDQIVCELISSSACASPTTAISNTITISVVSSNPSISIGTVTPTSTCGGTDGSIVVNGSDSGTLTWNGNVPGSMSTTLPATISGLMAGIYDITFDNGCGNRTISATVTETGAPTKPVITASGSTTICTGETVVLTSSETSGIMWSNGATTASITVNQAGTYTVTATAGTCSETSDPVTVTVNTPPATPTISADGSTSICEGSSVTLTSSSANGNEWSTGEISQSIVVSTAGSFSVTVTLNGCTSQASANTTVLVNPLPTVTLTDQANMCHTDDTLALDFGTPAGGTYTVNGTTATEFVPADHIGTNQIIYSFTSPAGCTGSDTIAIVVDQCVSIGENELNVFKLYPNPTRDQITISGEFVSKITEIRVHDATGRLVSSFAYKVGSSEGSKVLNLSDLADGLYKLMIISNEGIETQNIQIIK
ncbi:MAG: T9SS type A sorting domain-containing protein [Bacteroidetes bacterium]|nr:MAG: T9SS type A sorting domain-containing protein [Bacteroidota bacterium]